jgi:CheY-like chemotaxis protein
VKRLLKSILTRRTDTILIVEPDPILRRLERRALSSQYRIVQATSGEEAVRIAARHETNLDLLVTQARLPRMDGWELSELLRLDYPGLKVVYLSSSVDAEIRAHTRRSPVVVLEKNQFHSARLRQTVSDVLENARKDKAAFHGSADSPFSVFRRAWGKLHT